MGVTEAANFKRSYLPIKATQRLVLIGGLVIHMYSSNNTLNSEFTAWSQDRRFSQASRIKWYSNHKDGEKFSFYSSHDRESQ